MLYFKFDQKGRHCLYAGFDVEITQLILFQQSKHVHHPRSPSQWLISSQECPMIVSQFVILQGNASSWLQTTASLNIRAYGSPSELIGFQSMWTYDLLRSLSVWRCFDEGMGLWWVAKFVHKSTKFLWTAKSAGLRDIRGSSGESNKKNSSSPWQAPRSLGWCLPSIRLAMVGKIVDVSSISKSNKLKLPWCSKVYLYIGLLILSWLHFLAM